MKIIFSRKGFDSSAGGHASPILPDGRLVSLPIPSSGDKLSYDGIEACPGKSFGALLSDLGSKPRIDGKGAHLDPDLVRETRPRRDGWLPNLGQIGAAGGHLRNQGVGPGDLFLFYGWFRHASIDDGGRVGFVKDSPDLHVIFGYLQVGERLAAQSLEALPAWLHDHPHATPARLAKATNTIYVAPPILAGSSAVTGGGVFRFDDRLVLTKDGQSRGRWNLNPEIFQRLEISYHSPECWQGDYFQSYPRAQEYVVKADQRAADWAMTLVQDLATP